MDHDDPRAEEALLSREQDMREESRWADRYRTRVREPDAAFGFSETERARPDEHDEAVIRATVQVAEGPMALVPAGELALAALDRVISVLRRDATTTRALSEAHGAAELAGIAFGRLREQLAAELERAASTFPKECMACGAVHADTPEWQELALVGVQIDPGNPDLELRLCTCGSTIAMPRVSS